MAMDIADGPPNMVDVLISVVRPVLSEDLDNLAARLVALGLAPAVLLTDLFGLVGFKPLLKLLRAHVDRLVELLNNLLVALGHLPS